MKLKADKRIKYDINDPTIEQGLEIIAKNKYGKHSMTKALRYFHKYSILISQRSLYNLYQRALNESPDIRTIAKNQHAKRIHQDKLKTKKENNKPIISKPKLSIYQIGIAVDKFNGQQYPIYTKLNPKERYYFYSNYQFYFFDRSY